MKGSNPLFAALAGGLELTHARVVEVVFDPSSRTLWINTEDGCVGRICNIEEYHYRATPAPAEEG